MPRCLMKVQEVLSPIMGDLRGYRVLVALPNKAACTAFGQPTPSFEKPFRLALFGDFCSMQDVLDNGPKFGRVIRRMGFTDIELL